MIVSYQLVLSATVDGNTLSSDPETMKQVTAREVRVSRASEGRAATPTR
jgi:hypothetical protein